MITQTLDNDTNISEPGIPLQPLSIVSSSAIISLLSSCQQQRNRNWMSNGFVKSVNISWCWRESWGCISDNISGIDWGLSLHAQCYRRNILTAKDFYSTIDSRCMSLSLSVCDRKYLIFTAQWGDNAARSRMWRVLVWSLDIGDHTGQETVLIGWQCGDNGAM